MVGCWGKKHFYVYSKNQLVFFYTIGVTSSFWIAIKRVYLGGNKKGNMYAVKNKNWLSIFWIIYSTWTKPVSSFFFWQICLSWFFSMGNQNYSLPFYPPTALECQAFLYFFSLSEDFEAESSCFGKFISPTWREKHKFRKLELSSSATNPAKRQSGK